MSSAGRKNTQSIKYGVTCLLVLGNLAGCYQGGGHMPVDASPKKAPSGSAKGPFFTTDIQPIFAKRCTPCHDKGAGLPAWTEYSTAFAKLTALNDRLFVKKNMPMAPQTLDADEKKLIASWIEGGGAEAPAGAQPNPLAERRPPTPAAASPSDPGGPPTTPPALPPANVSTIFTFKDHIAPLFKRACSTCHGVMPNIPDLQNYAVAIERKDAILKRVVVDRTMPLGAKLTDEEIRAVKNWAEGGTLFDRQPLTAKPITDLPSSVTYDEHIKPLFAKACATCHVKGATTPPDWSNYTVAASRSHAIYYRTCIKKDMPLGGSLTDRERALIEKWADTGAAQK